MGFFDDLKDRFMPSHNDEVYEDEYIEEYDEGYQDQPMHSTGLLGNTSRPEVNSVSVYTRTGKRVDNGEFAPAPPLASQTPYNTHANYGAYHQPNLSSVPYAQVNSYTPTPLTQQPQSASPQLPCYVLRPVAYDDVQTVVRRVKTMQPVVLCFQTTNIDIAKRILDFSFGLSCGINGSVEELDDRVFVVLPEGVKLGSIELSALASQGVISSAE